MRASSVGGRFLFRFDGPASVAALEVTGASAEWSATVEDGAQIEGIPEKLPPTDSRAVHLTLAPGVRWPVVELSRGLAADWSGAGKLVFYVDNASEFMIPLVLTIRDAAGCSFKADHLWLVRSTNRIEIPLEEIRAGDGTPLDLHHIQSLALEIHSAEKFIRELWLYHVYLAGSAADAGRFCLLLGFAPQGAPLLAGARPIDERTAYVKWRGYGWTGSTRGFTSAQFNQTKPDPLLSSFVWADLGERTATLRVDLPDGNYRARFYGGNYTSKAMPQREFSLAVNGEKVASKSADPATHYSSGEYFRGIDNWYEPREDTWAKYGRDLYQHYDFSFTVRDGRAEFVWTKTLAAFGLLIASADKFESGVEQVDALRREHFNANLIQPAQPRSSTIIRPADRKRGFLLWSRDWQKDVAPFDSPAESERDPVRLRVVAAQGQRAHVTLTVTPLRPIGPIEASASLPGSTVAVRAMKYLWAGWPASLSSGYLFPTTEAPASPGLNLTWWLTVTPAETTRPGTYSGTVRLKAQNGGEMTVPVELEVLPFRLLHSDEHEASFSLWRNSDFNMSYALRYSLPGKPDYFLRLLDAEAASMQAHGMTAFHFTPPSITGVQGDHVILDFHLLEEECRAAKAHGLSGPGRPGLVFVLLEIARKLMPDTRYGDFQEPEELTPALPDAERVPEFSDPFNRRFLDAIRQIQDFFDGRGIPIMIQIADEPRERNINQWNRNAAECARYAELIHNALPRVRLYIDLEADTDNGSDYLPLIDRFQIIATHPWDRSAGIYQRTGPGKPTLRYYNGIVHDRYDWGYEVAASHATGFAQWHFGWQLQPFQPFQAENRSGMTLAGPDGPFDTPEYEIAAAGIDDYRYIATLRSRIAHAPRNRAVNEAQSTLDELLSACEPYARATEQTARTSIAGRSLDEWRLRLAQAIEAIDRDR